MGLGPFPATPGYAGTAPTPGRVPSSASLRPRRTVSAATPVAAATTADPTRAQLRGLRAQPQPPLELRQMRSQHRVPPRDRVRQIRHSTTVAAQNPKTTLFHHAP